MNRIVHIAGDPDTYEVICETDRTLVLINRSERLRQQVTTLEQGLADVRRRLDEHRLPQQWLTDINGAPIDGP